MDAINQILNARDSTSDHMSLTRHKKKKRKEKKGCCRLRDFSKKDNNQLKKLNLDRSLDDSKKWVLIGTFVRCHDGIALTFLE